MPTLPGQVTPAPGLVLNLAAPQSLVAIDANSLCGIAGHSIIRLSLDGTVTTVASVADASGYTEAAGSQARLISRQAWRLAPMRWWCRTAAPTTGQTTPWVGAAPQPSHVDGPGAQARFSAMRAMTVDANGNAYVIDNGALRKITAQGVASTLFQDFPSGGGLAIDAAGNFYGVRNGTIVKVTPAGVQSVLAGQAGVVGFADGPGASASFARPLGLAMDPQGNLVVGDAPADVAKLEGLPGRLGNSFTHTLNYGNTIRRITLAASTRWRRWQPLQMARSTSPAKTPC